MIPNYDYIRLILVFSYLWSSILLRITESYAQPAL